MDVTGRIYVAPEDEIPEEDRARLEEFISVRVAEEKLRGLRELERLEVLRHRYHPSEQLA